MTRNELIKSLEELSKKTNEEWMATLDERKLNELKFHDRYRDSRLMEKIDKDTYEKLYGNKKFYNAVQLSKNYINDWIKGHSKGKIFLDYACGNGVNAISAAKAGAELAIGIDLSDISIKNARALSREEGVSENTFFVQGDCENTGLPDECIDICICSGMLHHLDLNNAFYELQRILNKNGIILTIEALDHNPVIKLYRNMTPGLRTDWERTHILSYKDINFAQKFFDVKDIKHWHLFSIIGTFVPSATSLLNSIDTIVLKLPFIKMMSWMFSFELHKKGQ